MSLVDTLKGRASSAASVKAPTAATIARQLETERSTLTELEAQHGTAAFDALGGETGADKRLADLEAQLATQRNKVAGLAAALDEAKRREAAALAAQRKSLQQTQWRAMKKHLDLRDAAAKALDDAIEVAAANYKALLEHSDKARAATPIGMKFPAGSATEDTIIKTLVENALYKASASSSFDPHAFPGSVTPSATFEYQPAAIKPLADTIKEGSAFALAKLKLPE